MGERITEIDLQAYVDGQLDMARRIEVEAYLQRHPQAAARVMQDLKLCDEVRLFAKDRAWAPTPATTALGRQLARRLWWRVAGFYLRRGLAAAILIGAGWFANEALGLARGWTNPGAVPVFVDEAAEADHAIRQELAWMHDLRLHATIRLPSRYGMGPLPVPELKEGLQMVGADLVPWDGGTAIGSIYRTAHGDILILFAADTSEPTMEPPRAAARDGLTIAYWQQGHFVYALSGGLPSTALLAIAEKAASPRLDQPAGPIHQRPS